MNAYFNHETPGIETDIDPEHASEERTLESAMASPDKRHDISDSIRARAEDKFLEDKLAEDLGVGLRDEASDGDDFTPSTAMVSTAPAENFDADDSTVFSTYRTPRILELRRKQQTVRETGAAIESKLGLLSDIAANTDNVFAYLSKLEAEIVELEQVEMQHTQLKNMSLKLAKQSLEMKVELANQQKEIEMLQAMKVRTRALIRRAKEEIIRVREENKMRVFEISSRDMMINNLKDAKAELREKNDQLEGKIVEYDDRLDSMVAKLSSTEQKLSEASKRNADDEKRIALLSDERDRYAAELKELQHNLANLNDKHSEVSAAFEEKTHEIQTRRQEYEEKLKQKDTRILKLESTIGVLNNQVLIGEEEIANLSRNLDEERKRPEAVSSAKLAKSKTKQAETRTH